MKIMLIILLTLFNFSLKSAETDKEKIIKQVEINNKAIGKFYRDQKENPLPICLPSNEQILKLAKKCKVPYETNEQLLDSVYLFNSNYYRSRLYHPIAKELNCKPGKTGTRKSTIKEKNYKCVSLNQKFNCFDKKLNIAVEKLNCQTRTLQDYGYRDIEIEIKVYKDLAKSLGCAAKEGFSSSADECVARWAPTIIGSGPLSIENILEIKKNPKIMREIIKVKAEIDRYQNQGNVQEPSEEEKQLALAQQNSSGQATWKYTNGGVGYWDYGNGFGWAPPNPIRDNIIQGFSISQKAKNILMTGSNGKIIFVP